MKTRGVWALVVVLAWGCGSEKGDSGSAAAAGATGEAGAGGVSSGGASGAAGAGAGATGGAAGEGVVVVPSDFDCSATAPPNRLSPAPMGCGTDPTCDERLVSAHRGAGAPGALAPEDTLSAFRAAIAVGADFTECDVRVTSDGVPVVIHDADVDRTTTGSGAVNELSVSDLQALGIRASNYAGDFSCEKVPTLAEVLQLVKERIVLIVDGTKTDRTDLIVRTIADESAFDWVVYDHTDVNEVEAAVALDDRLNIALRATSQEELDARLTRFASHPPVYVHIQDSVPETMVPLVDAAGHRVFGLVFGVDIGASLGEDPSQYGPVYAAGVDILQSNRPDLVAQHLGRSRVASPE